MNRRHSVSSVVCVICSLILTLGAWGVVEAVGYPFADDFEGGLGNWTAETPWGETTAFYASPVSSATDSPSTLYGSSVDASLTLGSSVDLSSAARPVLRFRHRHQLEDGYDFGYVEVSTDGGSSWSDVLATYTGTQSSWTREQLDLAAYVGEADVRVRFRLVSDGTVNADGWYVDDVAIAEAPEPVVLDAPFAVETNSLELSWSQSAAPDFSAYRIYRASGPGVDGRAATLVAEITEVTNTGHTDITVTPKSTYFYAVMVLTGDDLHSLSNEEDAITPAGMDYPFLDDGEGTGTVWSAQGTWALSDETAFSGSHAWSDSPGTNYGNGISAQSLTLVSPIDLTSASSPVLSFVHSYMFAAGDSGYVEISADGGSSWTALDSFTNGDSDSWLTERIDLSSWTWSDDVLVRFRITTDPSTTADGWHVDDISVAESPTVVPPPILDQVTSHSMRVTWSENADLLFSHYAIHRSPTPGAGIQSTLVAEIFDQGATTFTDTGLRVETDYYYRVYAVSPYGTYSPDSGSESTDRTGGNPYPFFEDFEGSLESWNLEGDWTSTDTDKYEGDRSLTDSPGTTSVPSNTYAAWTSIDLSGSSWPVLSFWDRYAMANDWAFLDVSSNGTNWTRIYSATGALPTWTLRAIDLSPWRTATNLRIRFTVSTGSSVFDDGWYIDDLSVAEHSGSVSIPFFDNLESGLGNWLTSSWTPSADTPHSGVTSLRSTPNGTMSGSSQNAMELAGSFDLSGTTSPQLTFWLRGSVGDDGGFASQISTDGGLTWASLPNAGIGQYWSGDWTRFQVPLASYIQSGVRLRFLNTNSTYGGPSDLYVDDVAIEDMPDNVDLDPLVPHLKSIDLSWSESALGDFDRYEVYRSTSANVTVANDLVFTSTDPGDTAFTDTGLSIGATYYYRVFVFNSRYVATPSNEKSTTTVPLSFPFADPMENLDSWDATGSWGPDGASPSEGSFSLSDSPGDNSVPSLTSYILTAIDLSGSSWPVLSFWDRYAMANDWAFLDVSSNGTNWTRIYSATGALPTWTLRAIDLSPWRTATNLRIRFTVSTGSSVFDDGWYIDDLSVAEHSGSVSIPFFDDLESGLGNWLTSSWTPSADAPHSGVLSLRSTPNGTMSGSSQNAMELAGSFDLSGTTNPQLTFWLRGGVGDDGGFSSQISIDGGLTWASLPNAGIGQYWSGGWTRFQVPLTSYIQSGVRLRFLNTNSTYGGPSDLYVDDVAIEDMPDNVDLDPLVPHLKSIDLSWSESALGDFDRYEVYRSTSANVTVANDLVFTSTDPGDTAFTDTGLSIGATYYYRVFVFNSRYVATPSNEKSTTTVPLSFPFADPMENLDSWDATGSWGPDGASPSEGSFSLSDSPGDNSVPSLTSYILTAIDLSGSSWPVLSFWDRYAMANDWAFLDVSSNGTNWTRIYSATGALPTWTLRAIDLSPWRTATNLRIRFTVSTGSSVFDDGWYIDDLSVAEHSGSVSIPFFDDLESGLGNWLTSSWTPSADAPHSGVLSLRSTPNGTMSGSSQNAMELAGSFDLSGTTNPQLTFWLRGGVGDDGGFSSQISIDGGLTWASLPNAGIGQYWSGGWTRFQVPLTSYIQSGVRLRFLNTNSTYGGPSDLYVDDVAIEDMPDNVTLAIPDQITISSMRLSWNDLNDPDFAAYAVYRSQTPTVDTSSELVTTITEQTTTEVVDTNLQARTTYYYRAYFVDTSHVYSPSNSASGTTLGVAIPFADDFETDSGVWTFSGEWGRLADAGLGGSTSLGDSPGDFTSNVDTWALTAVDLTDATWPVVNFSERFDFAGHWGRFEISSNGGSSWTVLHGATSSQIEWVHRRFDLSPWRGQPQVWIRFFVDANSGVPADGWHIDNLYIGENPVAGSSGYPFFDGFEDGDENWLQGGWTLTDDNPYEGSTSILDTPASRLGNFELWLTYASELDLSDATDPLLTFQVRGNTPDNNYFRGQVSTNGGITWQDLGEIYIHDNQSLPNWTRMQTSLSGYLVEHLRLRFRVYGNYNGDSNIFLDNIAVGEQTPAAPSLHSPAWGGNEPTVRPTLVVNNAVDYQSDALTYHFQVFEDSELADLVAEVPGVAGGTATTAWEVDVDLLPDTQYWWRCQATDDTGHIGPWMETATFFVQLTDHPPTVPVIVGPSLGGQLPDLNGRLAWLESTDPDEDNGDYVTGYRVQVDDDPAFASVEIDEPSVTMTTKATGAISVSLV